VVDCVTEGVEAARTGAWVFALVLHAMKVLWAVWIDGALRFTFDIGIAEVVWIAPTFVAAANF